MNKKAKELREKSDVELYELLVELNRELFTLRMQRSLGALEKPHRFKEVKRQIARIKTILNERRRAQQ